MPWTSLNANIPVSGMEMRFFTVYAVSEFMEFSVRFSITKYPRWWAMREKYSLKMSRFCWCCDF